MSDTKYIGANETTAREIVQELIEHVEEVAAQLSVAGFLVGATQSNVDHALTSLLNARNAVGGRIDNATEHYAKVAGIATQLVVGDNYPMLATIMRSMIADRGVRLETLDTDAACKDVSDNADSWWNQFVGPMWDEMQDVLTAHGAQA